MITLNFSDSNGENASRRSEGRRICPGFRSFRLGDVDDTREVPQRVIVPVVSNANFPRRRLVVPRLFPPFRLGDVGAEMAFSL